MLPVQVVYEWRCATVLSFGPARGHCWPTAAGTSGRSVNLLLRQRALRSTITVYETAMADSLKTMAAVAPAAWVPRSSVTAESATRIGGVRRRVLANPAGDPPVSLVLSRKQRCACSGASWRRALAGRGIKPANRASSGGTAEGRNTEGAGSAAAA